MILAQRTARAPAARCCSGALREPRAPLPPPGRVPILRRHRLGVSANAPAPGPATSETRSSAVGGASRRQMRSAGNDHVPRAVVSGVRRDGNRRHPQPSPGGQRPNGHGRSSDGRAAARRCGGRFPRGGQPRARRTTSRSTGSIRPSRTSVHSKAALKAVADVTRPDPLRGELPRDGGLLALCADAPRVVGGRSRALPRFDRDGSTNAAWQDFIRAVEATLLF